MKRTKKLLALVLTLAMVMSVMVAPQANAAFPSADSSVALVYTGTAKYLSVTAAVKAADKPTTGSTATFVNKAAQTPVAQVGGFFYNPADLDGLVGLVDANGFFVTKADTLKVYTDNTLATPTKDDTAGNQTDAAGSFYFHLSALPEGFKLEATPQLANVVANNFAVKVNDVNGEYEDSKAVFTFDANGLLPEHKYNYTIEMSSVAGKIDKMLIVKGDFSVPAFTGTTGLYPVSVDWNGTYYTNSTTTTKTKITSIASELTDVTYTVTLKDAATYVSTAFKGEEAISDATQINKTFTPALDPTLNYTITGNTIPAVTPGTDATIALTLNGYNTVTMGDLYALVLDSNGDYIAAIKNTGNDVNAAFVWNGTYVFPDSGVPSGYDAASGTKGNVVDKGTYKVVFKSGKTAQKGPVNITVNEPGNVLYSVSTAYTDAKGATNNYLIPKDGKVVITVTGNKVGIPVTVNIKNKSDEVVLSTALATATVDGVIKASYSWAGLLANATDYIAEGAYTIEAIVTGTTTPVTKGTLQVGAPITVSAISTKDATVKLAAGAASNVELAFNPSNATTAQIKSVALKDANKYFSLDDDYSKWTNTAITMIGKEVTPADKPVDAEVVVTLTDGRTVNMKIKVEVVAPATDIKVANSIFRFPAATTGQKISYTYEPAGSTGIAASLYPVKKNADGTYTKLADTELAAANSIVEVAADGAITFKAPGRVLYVAEYNGKQHEIIVLTTTEFAQELLFFPADGEMTIKAAGILEDASKQPRVAAYVRPVHVADTQVTYSTSDANVVSFRYALRGVSSITNDSTTVPAGANAGALVGEKAGEATVTATSRAKTAGGEQLKQSIVVKVVEAE